ncbi:glycoside hydrolase family 125 protein [Amycolatopsis mongoliensis]|uniref:Glycoside hydrolase family 125 protein n=1 Tax=Amycolatopsis mongoliensis TaxID=715475 RepID=A0A9Y2JGU0_9PSEU|nr:glycoside hydrolase family 125 protein [Amycolatopsis sp. 4-36]WIX98234.1 glycoside hydrolase family 125 protein [Amycolatopsis sp. 4-36]
MSETMAAAADRVRAVAGERIGDLVEAALLRTLRDTVTIGDDGSAFVITGDIPAMWLRDSTTQLTPYLRFLGECPPLAELVAAVVRRQFACLEHDPYANAFNDGPTGAHYEPGDLCDDPHVWEQKYEVDSLAHPVTLAHALWRKTGSAGVFDARAHRVLRTIVAQLRLEQRHDDSPYRFERPGAIPTETLARGGRGTPVAVTGMTWSGFRPSDDACTYGYHIPANLFAAQALLAIGEIADEVYRDAALATGARTLSRELVEGVESHGIVDGTYAYEVDGLGGVLRMDDANTPSLLSLPLIAPDVVDADVWRATRAFVLSDANPYYFRGRVASGIGSPHTKPGRVWPIALAVEGLTGTPADRRRLLHLIAGTDAGTGRVHESFDASDPATFSRPWFSWADSMFCELALAVADDR